MLALAAPGVSNAYTFWDYPRTLWMRRPASGEECRAMYWANGQYHTDGFRQACYLLRDVKANATVSMDPVLLDILRGIQGWFEAAGIITPIIINSGYRTAKTNSGTEGAARNSKHMQGRAADIWIANVPSDYLAKLALYLQGGGVGIYASKGFIHVDTGTLRVWRG